MVELVSPLRPQISNNNNNNNNWIPIYIYANLTDQTLMSKWAPVKKGNKRHKKQEHGNLFYFNNNNNNNNNPINTNTIMTEVWEK
jgi:hypothetical protein